MATILLCDGEGCRARSPDDKGSHVANGWTELALKPERSAHRLWQPEELLLCEACTKRLLGVLKSHEERRVAETSLIEWTDATWNPVTGCSVVSPGCTNCYAMRLAGTRLRDHPSRAGLTTPTKAGPVWNGAVRLNEAWLTQPLTWKRPRRIFVAAHGDLFHEAVPDAWIDQVFAVMALAPHHTFQILTKRSARMRAYFDMGYVAGAPRRALHVEDKARDLLGQPSWDLPHGWPLPNVWLGVSAEDQPRADERIPDLLATPAAVRFLSAEPLLGPIDLAAYLNSIIGKEGRRVRLAMFDSSDGGRAASGGTPRFMGTAIGLDWVIAGGESGPGARPMHPDWPRQLRDACAAAGTAFFFKQWGEWLPSISDDDGEHLVCFPDDGGDEARLKGFGVRPIHRFPGQEMWRVGKKAAGCLLDGVTHHAFPIPPLIPANAGTQAGV